MGSKRSSKYLVRLVDVFTPLSTTTAAAMSCASAESKTNMSQSAATSVSLGWLSPRSLAKLSSSTSTMGMSAATADQLALVERALATRFKISSVSYGGHFGGSSSQQGQDSNVSRMEGEQGAGEEGLASSSLSSLVSLPCYERPTKQQRKSSSSSSSSSSSAGAASSLLGSLDLSQVALAFGGGNRFEIPLISEDFGNEHDHDDDGNGNNNNNKYYNNYIKEGEEEDAEEEAGLSSSSSSSLPLFYRLRPEARVVTVSEIVAQHKDAGLSEANFAVIKLSLLGLNVSVKLYVTRYWQLFGIADTEVMTADEVCSLVLRFVARVLNTQAATAENPSSLSIDGLAGTPEVLALTAIHDGVCQQGMRFDLDALETAFAGVHRGNSEFGASRNLRNQSLVIRLGAKMGSRMFHGTGSIQVMGLRCNPSVALEELRAVLQTNPFCIVPVEKGGGRRIRKRKGKDSGGSLLLTDSELVMQDAVFLHHQQQQQQQQQGSMGRMSSFSVSRRGGMVVSIASCSGESGLMSGVTALSELEAAGAKAGAMAMAAAVAAVAAISAAAAAEEEEDHEAQLSGKKRRHTESESEAVYDEASLGSQEEAGELCVEFFAAAASASSSSSATSCSPATATSSAASTVKAAMDLLLQHQQHQAQHQHAPRFAAEGQEQYNKTATAADEEVILCRSESWDNNDNISDDDHHHHSHHGMKKKEEDMLCDEMIAATECGEDEEEARCRSDDMDWGSLAAILHLPSKHESKRRGEEEEEEVWEELDGLLMELR